MSFHSSKNCISVGIYDFLITNECIKNKQNCNPQIQNNTPLTLCLFTNGISALKKTQKFYTKKKPTLLSNENLKHYFEWQKKTYCFFYDCIWSNNFGKHKEHNFVCHWTESQLSVDIRQNLRNVNKFINALFAFFMQFTMTLKMAERFWRT